MNDERRVTAREKFGDRADVFDKLEVFSEERYYEPIIAAAAPVADDRVLDLAAGTGLLAMLLARQVESVVGCDVTPEMLDKARARLSASGLPNVTLLEAEAGDLPFADGVFDLATCRAAFHHFPRPRAALAEAFRVLAPGGRLVIEDPFGPEDDELDRERIRLEELLDPSHVRAYRPDELREMLAEAGFVSRAPARILQDFWPTVTIDTLLELSGIEDQKRRLEVFDLAMKNIDLNLGGLRFFEVEGELMVRLDTAIVSAVKLG